MNRDPVTALARPEILALSPYRPRPRPDAILLDNNESPYMPPDVGGELAVAMNRYPLLPDGLKSRIAAHYGVAGEELLLTRGSDDGIDALCRTFCRAGEDGVIVTPPTFGMYAVSARIQGAEVREIPLREDFSYPVDEVAVAIDDSTRLVFACSPNNPSGNAIPLDDICRLCEAASGRAIVVVDEAYGEFMSQEPAATLIAEFQNLAVLRTASKGMALAGARLGFLLGQATLVDLVQRVLPPYPLPTPTLQAADRIYSDGALDIAARRAKELVARREELSVALSTMGPVTKVWPSDANYLLAEFADAAVVSKALREKGILVRGFDTTRLLNALRISVGSAAENRVLLEALEEIDAQVSGE